MGPKMSLDQPDAEYDYVKMSFPVKHENGKLDIKCLHHCAFNWLKNLAVSQSSNNFNSTITVQQTELHATLTSWLLH